MHIKKFYMDNWKYLPLQLEYLGVYVSFEEILKELLAYP